MNAASRLPCETETTSVRWSNAHGTSTSPRTASDPPSTYAAQRFGAASPAIGMASRPATAIAPPREIVPARA